MNEATLRAPHVLIHSADPHIRPVVITVSAHVSVHAFQNIAKQNKLQVNIMIATGVTVCLAEGIIDDTCLVYVILVLEGCFTYLPQVKYVVIIFTQESIVNLSCLRVNYDMKV